MPRPFQQRPRKGGARLPFEILYEDRDVIAIDKPAGLLATHTRLQGRAARESQPTAENFLTDYVRKGQTKSRLRAWLVHRLDRDTSGVMIFAKSRETAEWFRNDWGRLTSKTYLAIVQGEMEKESGVFESFLKEDADGYRVRSVPRGTPGAKQARTEWRLVEAKDGKSLVSIKLPTGRKNQIRVHFADAGHPVLGDVKYGGMKNSRLQLHSARIEFVHPHSAKRVTVDSRMAFPSKHSARGRKQ